MSTPTDGPAPQTRLIGARGAASVAVASAVSALAGYVVLVVVAHHLTRAENARFVVYWSLLFAVFAVLGGVQQEATRAVGHQLVRSPAPDTARARILPWGMGLGAAVAVLVALGAVWWVPLVGVTGASPLVLVTALAVVLYAGHLGLVGVLAGARQWETSSLLIAVEALVRVGLVVVAAAWGAGISGLGIAVAASAATWLGLLVVPAVRSAARRHADAPAGELVRRLLQACLAGTGPAVLVVGFPLLLRATTDEVTWRTAAPLVLAISMTRAPLMVPLAAFQGVAIGYFLDPRRNRVAALVRVCAVVVAVGVVGAGLAAAVGPPLMVAILDEGYRVAGSTLAGLTAAAAVLALLVLVGSAVLAVGRHGAFALGWGVATAVAVALLLGPGDVDTRAVVSLAGGPAVGVAVLVLALRRELRRAPTPDVPGGTPSDTESKEAH